MCCLNAVTIGKSEEYAVGNGLQVGAWAVDTQEVRSAARAGDCS
jgi:hypothetical protein